MTILAQQLTKRLEKNPGPPRGAALPILLESAVRRRTLVTPLMLSARVSAPSADIDVACISAGTTA
jgi:hypothetical protein